MRTHARMLWCGIEMGRGRAWAREAELRPSLRSFSPDACSGASPHAAHTFHSAEASRMVSGRRSLYLQARAPAVTQRGRGVRA